MAYDIGIAGTYSGRSNHSLHLYVRRNGVSGNSSQYAWELYAQRDSGAVSYGLECKPWSVAIGGQSWSGCSALDFRNTSRITLASGYTQWFGHNSSGELHLLVDCWHNTAPQVIGNADPPAAWFITDRIAQPPNAPTMQNPINFTTTSFGAWAYVGAENGAAITQTHLQWATDPGFNNIVWNDYINVRGNVYSDPSGLNVSLNPGTTYYVRAHSDAYGIGWSGWSNTVSGTTLPATPPGMSVAPSPSGMSAVVSLTPPGGVSGVNSYWIDWRVKGTTTWVSQNGGPSQTVTPLTPGASYEWKASAMIGSYESPKTAILTVVQPNPSTTPGDYFDGSTAATADQTYSWTGTANNSTSVATGVTVLGWLRFQDGNPTPGATGVVARVTGGLYGTYAARVTFTSDQTVVGFKSGTGMIEPGPVDVTPAATYVGSVHVNPSKTNILRPALAWFNAAGALIGTSEGTNVTVNAGVWTRLVVSAVAPPLAEFAAAWWVTPAEGSFWLGGDTVLMDAAMVSLGTQFPYFDGSFADTGGFNYAWVDPAKPNASPSIRTDVAVTVADALLDPDCPPVPAPPRPPIVLDDCIDEVGVWRRYYAMIPATEVSDWLDVLPTFTLSTFGLAERQVRIRIYANPFNYPISQVNTADWCGEQIISYLPPNTVMTLDAEIQRVFASVAGGATQAADHLLYGSGGTPATWPVLTCGMSYLVSIDTPLDAPAGNTVVEVDLTRRAY
jgi:hypothetical protein